MKVMKKEFVTYELALELKNLGFDEFCVTSYGKFSHLIVTPFRGCHNSDGSVTVPTFSQAFRWFRDNYRKVNYPEFDYDEQKWHCHSDYKAYVFFNTYEEAELACLKKLIEIVKTK